MTGYKRRITRFTQAALITSLLAVFWATLNCEGFEDGRWSKKN